MSFSSLHALVSFHHRHLNELIILHQEALLLQRPALAREFLALFRCLVTAHIEAENQYLIPRLTQCTAARWPALLYRKEHDKIVAMLEKTETLLTALEGLSGQAGRRAILALLDYERAFRNVMEHHEEREEVGLLQELDATLPAADCQQLIHLLQQQWEPIIQQHQRLLPALVAQLQGCDTP